MGFILMKKYFETVKSNEQLERIIENWGKIGYSVIRKNSESVTLRKQNWGDVRIHFIIFLFTCVLLGIPNIIYALYSYYIASTEWEFKIDKIKNTSSISINDINQYTKKSRNNKVQNNPKINKDNNNSFKCSNCGGIVNENTIFCKYCGKNLKNNKKNKSFGTNKKSMSNLNKALLVILVIIILSFGLIAFSITNMSSNKFNLPEDDFQNYSVDNSDDYSLSDSSSSSSSDMDNGYYLADSSLSQFDSDSDGMISWSEWVAWCEYDAVAYGYEYTDYASSDFYNYDSNGDGYLNREELAEYLIGPKNN